MPVSGDPPRNHLSEGSEENALRRDLTDARLMQGMLEPKGIKGASFYCPSCETTHHLEWDLLVAGLRQLLSGGHAPIHEPAHDPDPDEYVSWDYACGLLDAYLCFRDTDHHDISVHLVNLTEAAESEGGRSR